MIRSAAANRERNARGSAADRRARKLWILRTWGNGETCPCVNCGEAVNYDTMEVDRIVPGGSYRRENVQPLCRPCNLSKSGNADWDGSIRPAALAFAVIL